ncbi:MAG: DoxX family membrane protein [Candidatus Yonathbacteria bacterium]|nr:DoxX family membrane protein [Candidatus Yonathbacteria bacterium]
MTILTLFPELLSFSFFAPFLLRVVIGIIFFRLGCLAVREKRRELADMIELVSSKHARIITRILGMLECLSGTLLVFGLFTQAAALSLTLLTAGTLVLKFRFPDVIPHHRSFLVLILAVLLSLLLTGAGIYAVDLPL